MTKQRPTREEILDLLDYDAESGILEWKVARGSRARPGDTAGSASRGRERRLSVNGQMFSNAQVIWFLEKDRWPESFVRRKDGNPLNDRIDNLYEFGKEKHSSQLGLKVYQAGDKWNVEYRFRLIGSYDSERDANVIMEGIRRALG